MFKNDNKINSKNIQEKIPDDKKSNFDNEYNIILNKKTKRNREEIENNSYEFKSNPESFHFLNKIITDTFSYELLDNTFCVFNSIENNICYLIKINEKKSIICHNIISGKKINEIKNAHNYYIINFRHFFDKDNKRDLVISISDKDNNLKVWDIVNLNCLLNLMNINQKGLLFSACFLKCDNQLFIVSSNCYGDSNPIKIFNIKGNKVKEINDPDTNILFIESFYDVTLGKNYIITGNKDFAKSYDYNESKIYNKYYDGKDEFHYSVIINDKDLVELLESSSGGKIRIWKFHTGELLNIIEVSSDWLYGTCLWNKKYLFVACHEKAIKIIELESRKVIKELTDKDDFILSIKKIIHPKYGECLISHGYINSNIKLWIKKD